MPLARRAPTVLLAAIVVGLWFVATGCSSSGGGGGFKTQLVAGGDVGDDAGIRVDVDTKTVLVVAKADGRAFLYSKFTQAPIFEGAYEKGTVVLYSEGLKFPRTTFKPGEPLPHWVTTLGMPIPDSWGLTFTLPPQPVELAPVVPPPNEELQ